MAQLKGEWYRESQPPGAGMQRLPLPTPAAPAVYRNLPPVEMNI